MAYTLYYRHYKTIDNAFPELQVNLEPVRRKIRDNLEQPAFMLVASEGPTEDDNNIAVDLAFAEAKDLAFTLLKRLRQVGFLNDEVMARSFTSVLDKHTIS